ncbi:MAG: hypothetical protein IPK53_19540 [bacterium]|nr:hypothetical protein [bacterium]
MTNTPCSGKLSGSLLPRKSPYHASLGNGRASPARPLPACGDAGFLKARPCLKPDAAWENLTSAKNLILTKKFMAAPGHRPWLFAAHRCRQPYLSELAKRGAKAALAAPDDHRRETITANAMTEPNAGSDLAGTQTPPRLQRPLPPQRLKTFITNGILNDLVIVAAKTDPTTLPAAGLTPLVVERGIEVITRGRNLEKWLARPGHGRTLLR